jgi:flagellar P-ring protein FlgI
MVTRMVGTKERDGTGGSAGSGAALALRFALPTAAVVLLLGTLPGASTGILTGTLRAQTGKPPARLTRPATAPAAEASVQVAALVPTAATVPPAVQGAGAAAGSPIHLARIKDIASIEGIRDNQLVGYGIVVGLHGTGDSQQTTFPIQTLAATLLRMGVSVPAGSIKVQNLAAVFISATLPPFSRPGTKLDITAASAGDAQSLEGGLLLMTPLYGSDGRIYAQAEGALVVGGYSVSVNGNTKQMNHPTTARIPGGGMVERGLSLDISDRKNFSILLNDADFRSAGALAAAINQELGRPAARALDSRRIDLEIAPGEDVPMLLARVEAIEVPFYPRAMVVVNERTGTVVIGGTVVLQPVSILHGGLAINVVSDFEVSQPNAFSSGTTQVLQQTRVEARDKPVNRIELKQGATVDDLVRSLQAIGATARDVISILQAMKAAGALEAEIEVL